MADENAAKQEVETLIKQLDDEKYEVRRNAAKNLAALGLRVRPILVERLAALEKKADASAELTNGLQKVIRGIDTEALAERLQQKISFEFKDKPLAEALEALKLNFILNPKLSKEAAATPVNLTVRDMSLANALLWTARLAKLSYCASNRNICFCRTEDLAEFSKGEGYL